MRFNFADGCLTNGRRCTVFLLSLGILISLCPATPGQSSPPGAQAREAAPASPSFADSDAVTIFNGLQQAIESLNRKRFFDKFDATKMVDFPAFRTQVSDLFQRYDSLAVTYHLTQTGMEGNNAVALADFGLDGIAASEDMPDLRRQAQLRLVLAWNGKEWKIVDLSPRALFQ
jgi:hypothetical protein